MAGACFWIGYTNKSQHHCFDSCSYYYDYKFYKKDIPLAIYCGPAAICGESVLQAIALGELAGYNHGVIKPL